MRLFFLRHGLADWPHWHGPDDDRPLTDAGCRELEGVANFVARLKRPPELILTSPLPRASETARIVAMAARIESREEPQLAPGFDPTELSRILARLSQDAVMVVGHEPDFSRAIRSLTSARIKFPKAAVACTDIEAASAAGKLLWLVTPNVIRACDNS